MSVCIVFDVQALPQEVSDIFRHNDFGSPCLFFVFARRTLGACFPLVHVAGKKLPCKRFHHRRQSNIYHGVVNQNTAKCQHH